MSAIPEDMCAYCGHELRDCRPGAFVGELELVVRFVPRPPDALDGFAHRLALRLEIAAPRERPEPAERLLAVDHVGGRFHMAPVDPRSSAIVHCGRFMKIGGGEVAGSLLQTNEPLPLVLGSLDEELSRQNQASADDRADDRQHRVRDHANSPYPSRGG